MLEILRYIFSSFWGWLGTVVLIGLAGEILARLFRRDPE